MRTFFRRPAACLRLIPILLLVALLAGCQSALYGQLNEQQINEMTSVLESHGIATAREQNKDGTYALSVDQSRFADALGMLSQLGYPRAKYQGVGDVFTGDKLVSTSFEEKARFVYAQEQELSDSLTRIAGVTDARVHITIPDQDPLSDKIIPSRAAVFVYYANAVDLRPKISVIKSLVVSSIQNMTYDNVTVALFPAEGIRPVEAPPAFLESVPIIPIVLVGALGLFLLTSSWLQDRRRVKLTTGGESKNAVAH
jgi:type III secretion protein J